MKRILYISLFSAMAVILTACMEKEPKPPYFAHVESVSFVQLSMDLHKNRTYRIKLDNDFVILPENAGNKKVTYFTRNDRIATVSSDGLITSVDLGTTYIGVKTSDMRKEAEIKITVVPFVAEKPMTSFSIGVSTHIFDIEGGDPQSLEIIPTFEPADATDPYFIFESLDPYIASAEADHVENATKCTVLPGSYGKVKIRVIPIDGSGLEPKIIEVAVNATRDRNFGITGGINTDNYYDIIYKAINIQIGEVGGQPVYQTWLDRNLGASQVATAKNDHLAFGSKFQFSRKADGHEKVTYTNIPPLSGTVVSGFTEANAKASTRKDAGTDKFILVTSTATPYDWASDTETEREGLWGGKYYTDIGETFAHVDPLESTYQSNNPCPSGYRLPSGNEWLALLKAVTGTEVVAGASGTASAGSPDKLYEALKLPASGEISRGAMLFNLDGRAFYWGNAPLTSGNSVRFGYVGNGGLHSSYYSRSSGYAVRCIKHTPLVTTNIILD